MRVSIALLSLLLITACTTVSPALRTDAYYDANAVSAVPVESMFSGDAAVLSDESIQKILAYKYSPPALNRIALMAFGRETWSSWSEELAVASERMQSEVINTLRSSPRVYDASYLPSILIPENRTVPHLREAAARYQADLLLGPVNTNVIDPVVPEKAPVKARGMRFDGSNE